MRYHSLFIAIIIVTVTLCTQASVATAQGTAQRVQAALDEADRWVGPGENGNRWREILKSSDLRRELGKGSSADKATVRQVLDKYRSGVPGLESPQFVGVRDALDEWYAELSMPKAEELPAAIRAAKGSFVPVTEKEVDSARANFTRAHTKLNQYLGRGSNGQAWRTFLKLDELQAQLQAPRSDAAALKAIQERFSSDNPGLEMPVFADVGTALKQYVEVLETANNPEAKAQFDAQLEELAKALEGYAKKPTEPDARLIGGILAKLEGSRQAAPLVKATRLHFSRPNLWSQISEEIVAVGIDAEVDDKTPITDTILGANIRGTAHTKATVRAELVPNPLQAWLDTVLLGTASSRTIATKGPARVYSNGLTRLLGRKRLVIDAEGIKGLPPLAQAETRSTITGIGTSGGIGSGIVQRAANDQAYGNKPQAERIAARHAEDRLRRRIDSQANETIARANRDYKEKFRDPLTRKGAFPKLLRFETTDQDMFVTALEATSAQLAAPTAPPALEGYPDMSVRLHESMANNLAQAMLAGETITDKSVQDDAMRILGKIPDELKREPDDEPWSMTFTADQPVTLVFFDGGFKVTVRGQRYTSGERVFQAMNVSATYKIERAGKGSKAVREGELVILPPGYTPGTTRLSNQQVALRTLLQKRFTKLFKPEMVSEGLELPGKWKNAGKLALTQLAASENGWLLLGWDRDPNRTASAE